MKLVHNNQSSEIPLKLCNTFLSRFKGLMFVLKPITNGIVIEPCNSIHMFFMFQSIDVVMVNSESKVVYLKKGVKPYSVIFPIKDGQKTFELPIETIDSLGIKLGDSLTY